MSQEIYIHPHYCSREEAKISVYDHGLLYGDGVFEGMRIYDGKVFRLDAHLDRLYKSGTAIELDINKAMSKADIAKAVDETVQRNREYLRQVDPDNGFNGYVRLVVTRGSGALGLDPYQCDNPQVIIIVDKIKLYAKTQYEQGLKIICAKTRRNHPDALDSKVKSLNYLNNIMAKIEGLKAGCSETLMLNFNSEVAECTGDNIFIVKDGQLITPPVSACILEGITRAAVLELAGKLSIPNDERTLTLNEVYEADECFLTGSAAEIIAVVELDKRTIGGGVPGDITKQLSDAFHQLVRSE